jgi:hypothetical protein
MQGQRKKNVAHLDTSKKIPHHVRERKAITKEVVYASKKE